MGDARYLGRSFLKGALMPRMIHPNVVDTIDADEAKVAIYEAQGWVLANQPEEPVEPTAVKRPAKRAAKKSAAKKPK